MIGAGRRMRGGEGRHGDAVGEQGRMRDERSGQDRRQMAAAVGGVDERVQQVDAFILGARLIGMVVRVQRLRVFRAAAAGFMQIAHRGEYGVHQHRKHEQCQRGKAQPSDKAVAEDADHRTGMLRDAPPVKQLQH